MYNFVMEAVGSLFADQEETVLYLYSSISGGCFQGFFITKLLQGLQGIQGQHSVEAVALIG